MDELKITKVQELILNLTQVAITIKDNVQFFELQSRNKNTLSARKYNEESPFFNAFQVNTIAFNHILATIFHFKSTIPKEEYEFLTINHEVFKAFDRVFLQEETTINVPETKPKIYLPGDM